MVKKSAHIEATANQIVALFGEATRGRKHKNSQALLERMYKVARTGVHEHGLGIIARAILAKRVDSKLTGLGLERKLVSSIVFALVVNALIRGTGSITDR